MDLSPSGAQPFKVDDSLLVCNGEIYNYKKLKLALNDFNFLSQSDCEVLLPYIKKFGLLDLLENIDGEFAFSYWDSRQNKLFAARDPMGIRPLFYGKMANGKLAFASEVKALLGFCQEIKAFPPGHYYDGSNFHSYHDHSKALLQYESIQSDVLKNINHYLTQAVLKRLSSDAPIGFLLSGGLDSSLVAAMAQRFYGNKPIQTFSIGMKHDAIDSKYAEIVASFIGAHHTSVEMEVEEVISGLREVIFHLETWDITTIRASIGMFLVAKYVRKNTSIKVLLTGEVSDELFGYKYTDFAPSAIEFQKEAEKRIRELYMYDVLRADRSIAAHSLEARVPFSDRYFVDYVMSINPELKLNKNGIGKFLLREAFKDDKLLPESILWREKAAFSDAVGHSMVDELKSYAEKLYSDEELLNAKNKYLYRPPYTKESLLYRDIFEEFYPNQAGLISDYWLPNQSWENCNVLDPSARVLPNYGKSGK